MKYIIVLAALMSSSLAYSMASERENTQCFNVVRSNKTEACTIIVSGNSDESRVTLGMKGGQVVILEAHPYEPERTYTIVGKTEETAVPGKQYYRDATTKKTVTNYKEGDWYCAKQIKGEIDVCHLYK